MVLESSAICARNSRILSGSGSSLMRSRRDQPLPPLDEENKISLRPHQALRRGRAVEVSSDQLLDFARLKPDVAPEPGDVAIEQNQIAVHRSLRAKVIISCE
jgi:hypothetical protein